MLMVEIDAARFYRFDVYAFYTFFFSSSFCYSGSVHFVVGLFPFWFLILVSTLSRYTKLQHLFSAYDGSAAGQTDIIEPPRKHTLFAHYTDQFSQLF